MIHNSNNSNKHANTLSDTDPAPFYKKFLNFYKFSPDQFTENDFITNYNITYSVELFARKLPGRQNEFCH